MVDAAALAHAGLGHGGAMFVSAIALLVPFWLGALSTDAPSRSSSHRC